MSVSGGAVADRQAVRDYSQYGEAGVIARLLDGQHLAGWMVDVGAHDGRTNSNIRCFVDAGMVRGVFIEGDSGRFRLLAESTPVGSVSVQAVVTTQLDAILKTVEDLPNEFDVLSIDVDGVDYHVWSAMERYRPKVVVIEFNPTMPPRLDWVQPLDLNVRIGASVEAMVRLGRAKGYRCMETTLTNAVFLRDDLGRTAPSPLRDIGLVGFGFWGYDGQWYVVGHQDCPWTEEK